MYEYEHPRPAVTTDIVLFSTANGARRLLLVERGSEPFRGCWALPGGFLEPQETLEECARRELAEETGITGVELRQLQAFSEPDRDPRGRVISVAFRGTLDGVPGPSAGSDAAAARWFPLDALPELAFDHAQIVAVARERRSG